MLLTWIDDYSLQKTQTYEFVCHVVGVLKLPVPYITCVIFFALHEIYPNPVSVSVMTSSHCDVGLL